MDESLRHECGDCNNMFCTGKLLRRHVNIEHIGLVCEKCGNKFPLKSSLEFHVGNIIELTCSECEVIFCNLLSLRKHKNKMHKYISYAKCDVCNETYQEDYLRHHKLMAHKHKTPEDAM